MFVPSHNLPNNLPIVYVCKLCDQLKTKSNKLHVGETCEKCMEKLEAIAVVESGGENKNNALPDERLLLDVYYRREIKISFSNNTERLTRYYTALMIPNKDGWLKEKMDEAKNQLKCAGLKNVSLKTIGDFYEMDEDSINFYANKKTEKIRLSSTGNECVTLPLVLNNYANAKGGLGINWWKIVNILVFISSILAFISSVGLFIFCIYNKIWLGFLYLPLSILTMKYMHKSYIETK